MASSQNLIELLRTDWKDPRALIRKTALPVLGILAENSNRVFRQGPPGKNPQWLMRGRFDSLILQSLKLSR